MQDRDLPGCDGSSDEGEGRRVDSPWQLREQRWVFGPVIGSCYTLGREAAMSHYSAEKRSGESVALAPAQAAPSPVLRQLRPTVMKEQLLKQQEQKDEKEKRVHTHLIPEEKEHKQLPALCHDSPSQLRPTARRELLLKQQEQEEEKRLCTHLIPEEKEGQDERPKNFRDISTSK
ncbi:hypothetical protein DUI87_22002 [Hirundo rustica rustica]|uniref:Uncharacterized protein n=1 Tax=Hirundo rustica rustica TaxID=333673 RepID=A0A3M0JMN1_HIRRU|nr:hypothetical protein DUI87_22002 [Hirundo rustica rustica]